MDSYGFLWIPDKNRSYIAGWKIHPFLDGIYQEKIGIFMGRTVSFRDGKFLWFSEQVTQYAIVSIGFYGSSMLLVMTLAVLMLGGIRRT